jgi:hypothetical protein
MKSDRHFRLVHWQKYVCQWVHTLIKKLTESISTRGNKWSAAPITTNFRSSKNYQMFCRQWYLRQRFSIACFWRVVVDKNLRFTPKKLSIGARFQLFFSIDRLSSLEQKQMKTWHLHKHLHVFIANSLLIDILLVFLNVKNPFEPFSKRLKSLKWSENCSSRVDVKLLTRGI